MTYTHGHHESVVRSHSWRTAENSAAYLLPELHPGLSLLDIGCGPGTITVDLARIVAPGEVVGVDASREIVAQAEENARDTQLANLRFEIIGRHLEDGAVLLLGLRVRARVEQDTPHVLAGSQRHRRR